VRSEGAITSSRCNHKYEIFAAYAYQVIAKHLAKPPRRWVHSAGVMKVDADDVVILPRATLMDLVRQYEAIDPPKGLAETIFSDTHVISAVTASPGPAQNSPLLAAEGHSTIPLTLSSPFRSQVNPLTASLSQRRPPPCSNSASDASLKRQCVECITNASLSEVRSGICSDSLNPYALGPPSFFKQPSSSPSASWSDWCQQALSGSSSASLLNFANSFASTASGSHTASRELSTGSVDYSMERAGAQSTPEECTAQPTRCHDLAGASITQSDIARLQYSLDVNPESYETESLVVADNCHQQVQHQFQYQYQQLPHEAVQMSNGTVIAVCNTNEPILQYSEI